MDSGMAQQSETRDRGDCDIAIVGMACMFPKSPDLRRYWENIMQRLDCVQEVPADRWKVGDFFDDDRLARDKIYSKWGGFLESIRFDPMKWKIPPASLLSIDPIQLLSLEVANQAFEDAGYHERAFPKERTGVIFACAGSHDVGSDYAFRTMLQHYLPRVTDLTPEMRAHITDEINATLPEWTEDSFPGFLMNVIAGRIANRFDLGGPNYVVDAACAASLAALHAAIGQLRLKTVDAMLVGAADGTNNPFCYMSFAKTHALSPRGRSRPFDNSADGIALGEGIGAIMIRRLADAERDGDHIYAVIKGIGASSDGRNRSMTAPHPPGQMLAMERAYTDADVKAASVSLVEAHGTGTAVGDSTEITSLHTLFSQATSDEQYAAVGSVKSMIGHTKTCAGIASLIKTAMALKHRVLPPTINVDAPNEKVDFRHSPFFINTETRPWFDELGDHPRRAGVSAFGFGGTNFHVVMEEYTHENPAEFQIDFTPRAAEICVWQRATRQELRDTLRGLSEQLATLPAEAAGQLATLGQLAFSIRHDEAGRSDQSSVCRLSIVATTIDDLRAKLKKAGEQLADKSVIHDPTGIYYTEAAPVARERVAFLYPGQGSQAINMLRDLAVVQNWGHDIFAAANRTLNPYLEKALTRYIYPPPAFSDDERNARQQALNDTRIAQPALGTVEVFATELLQRFGITPQAVAGHSYGEYVALYAAGAVGRDDLLKLSALRGEVSAKASETCPGAMAAIPTNARETQRIIDQHKLLVSLANLNSPRQTIIAGSAEAVEAAMKVFADAELKPVRLNVTAAFHTPSLQPAVAPLSDVLKKTKFRTPELPVYSNTLATAYPQKPAEIRKLLQRHLVEPVRFEEEMRQMRADGYDVFIEVGPGRVLSNLVGRIFEGDVPTTLTLDAGGRDGVLQFAHVLAQIATLGLPCQLEPWFSGRGLREESVDAFTARIVQMSTPKRSDWILSVQGAKPVTPLPQRKALPGDGLRAKFSGKTGAVGAASAQPADIIVPQQNGHGQPVDSTSGQTGKNGKHTPGFADLTASRLNGNVAPAPLPVSSRFPTKGSTAPAKASENGHAANGHHRNGHEKNGHEYNGHTDKPAANGQAANGQVANGHGPVKYGSSNGSGPVNGTPAGQGIQTVKSPVAPASPVPTNTGKPAATTEVLRKSTVSASSGLPMAPCMPLVTDWNTPQNLPLAATPAPMQIQPSQPMRSAVSMPQSPVAENGQPFNPATAQLVLQSQALMMQMLDLQKWQQQVALKFLDSHQMLLQGCAAGLIQAEVPALTAATPAALPVPQVAPQPVMHTAPQPVAAPAIATPAPAAPVPQVAAARPAPVAVAAPAAAPQRTTAVAPVPVSRPVTVTQTAVAVAPAPVAAPAVVAAPVTSTAVAHVAPQPAPSTNGAIAKIAEPVADHGIPSPETFKHDLLEAVSERTGYPVDMLDLELPMESGLGIDSIKTVEIFSNLKVYHSYFQQEDQDEEEALKEFTKLKTLGDIVSAYELRHQAMTSSGATPKIAASNGAVSNGSEVERYTLSAVEAPARNGQKKTSHVNS